MKSPGPVLVCCARHEQLTWAHTVQIPSDDCPFNEAPDMKAFEITEAGKEALLSKRFQMVRVNYANPDMVRSRRCAGSQSVYAWTSLQIRAPIMARSVGSRRRTLML